MKLMLYLNPVVMRHAKDVNFLLSQHRNINVCYMTEQLQSPCGMTSDRPVLHHKWHDYLNKGKLRHTGVLLRVERNTIFLFSISVTGKFCYICIECFITFLIEF